MNQTTELIPLSAVATSKALYVRNGVLLAPSLDFVGAGKNHGPSHVQLRGKVHADFTVACHALKTTLIVRHLALGTLTLHRVSPKYRL